LKLVRAKKLLVGLQDEYDRWENTVRILKEHKENLIGNCIIACAMLVYGGPFDIKYRKILNNIWLSKLKELNLPVISEPNLINVLGERVKIQYWKSI